MFASILIQTGRISELIRFLFTSSNRVNEELSRFCRYLRNLIYKHVLPLFSTLLSLNFHLHPSSKSNSLKTLRDSFYRCISTKEQILTLAKSISKNLCASSLVLNPNTSSDFSSSGRKVIDYREEFILN